MRLQRRGVLGGAVGAGSTLLAQIPAAEVAMGSPVADSRVYAIDLLGQPDTVAMNGCWLKEVNFRNFPASRGISGGVISLSGAALRELHWHAQASEWAYVLDGRCRVTILDPQGHSQVLDFTAGDIWYFPRGHGHSIQALGQEECRFVLAFDSGTYSEFGTFSATDWLIHTPKPVLAKTFGVPVSVFDELPAGSEFFAKAADHGAPPLDPKSGRPADASLSCRYPLRAQRPTMRFPGGTMRIASSREFPLSRNMTSALVQLDVGGLRNPHWHPNANEWQYVISGTARTTIFLSKGETVSYDIPAGHVAYIPSGCGHFTENVGATPVELLAVFDNGIYETVEFRDWLKSNTAALLAANLRLPLAAAEVLVR